MWWNRLLAALLALLMIAGGTLIAVLGVALTAIAHPLTAFKKTKREIPPACLLDPSLGSHEYVTANGIKFHCVSAGDTSKPLMLLLHGFPEFWFSWRYQLREFSSDYHVVAVDMRGYGDTDKPLKKTDYRMELLVEDVAQLIPALGYSSCVLGAHDWGGAVAWSVVAKHPELVDKFIVMNSPHSKVLGRCLRKSCWQFLKLWYMFMFQVPKLPELLLGMRDYLSIQDCFTGKVVGVKNKASFPPDVVEAYKYTFSKPGALTGPINYYRCMFSSRPTLKPYINRMIKVPTLIIWGDDDKALSSEMADEHDMVCTNLTVKHIPDCSHWVQQDAPDLCNQYISEFLARDLE